MKKGILFLMSVIAACFIFSLFTINGSEEKTSNDFTFGTTSAEIYVIKAYKGNVAVFLYNGESPVQVLDCKINSLPPDAAEALATGIEVTGDDELQKIIEAYD